MSLNVTNNKYHCMRCGAGGYSIGLYAKMRNMNNKEVFKELLERECYSLDRSKLEITPVNMIADIETRDRVYRAFLGMLKLDTIHRRYLKELGFLDSSIHNGMYRSIPKKYIKRRLVAHSMSKSFNLCGIPGFFQEEDFKWAFSKYTGFFVPVFNEYGLIQGLSIHLDKPYNNNQDIWFSSNNKINGTSAKNFVMKNSISEDTESLVITNNFLLGNLIKETINSPTLAFQNISNSYTVLNELEKNGIRSVLFVVRIPQANENLDYIINRIFRDLIPLGYNIDIKYVKNYKDFFDENFSTTYAFSRAA